MPARYRHDEEATSPAVRPTLPTCPDAAAPTRTSPGTDRTAGRRTSSARSAAAGMLTSGPRARASRSPLGEYSQRREPPGERRLSRRDLLRHPALEHLVLTVQRVLARPGRVLEEEGEAGEEAPLAPLEGQRHQPHQVQQQRRGELAVASLPGELQLHPHTEEALE